MSQLHRNLPGPSRTSSSLFSALFTERAFPHTLPISPFHPSLTFAVSLPKKLPLFYSASFAILQNGGIRAIPDLRHHLRDHQPVRLAVAPPSILFAEICFLGIRTSSRWAWEPSGLSGMFDFTYRVARPPPANRNMSPIARRATN